MEFSVTNKELEAFREAFRKERGNRAAMAAVTNAGINGAAKNQEVFRSVTHEFSLSLDPGKVTAQKQSGRCWMFAAMNVLRYHLMHSMNLDNFELSQNYTLFYDKLEKSNYFLENILETLEEPTEGRLIGWLLKSPLGDRGTVGYDMQPDHEIWGCSQICYAGNCSLIHDERDERISDGEIKGICLPPAP